MRKVIISLLFAFYGHWGYGQGINIDSLMGCLPEMGDNICLSSVVADETAYTPDALKILYSNMDRLISSHGILNLKETTRFFLATNHNVISKDIVPGIPTRISETIQFNFIIGDILTEKVFSSIAIQVKGVGLNENKALISAIQAIKWKNKEIENFIDNAKNEIVAYYTEEASNIFQKAELLAESGKYEEAIGQLISIPSACPQHKESMRKALVTYQNMINNQAIKFLRKAKSEWGISQDRRGAQNAVSYLDSIPSGTIYENEIAQLLQDINKKIDSIDKREWEFKKQQYNDSIRHLKAEERAAKMKEYIASHPYSSNTYSRSTKNMFGEKGLFGDLVDKWNEQPTWKKVLIGGGIGLAVSAAAAVTTVSSVAGALLARTSFHLVKFI